MSISVNQNQQQVAELPNWFLAHRDSEYKILLENYDPKKVGNLTWKYLSQSSKINDKVLSTGIMGACVVGGGLAGAKTGGYLGMKYGKWTSVAAWNITLLSGFIGGITGSYVGYHAVLKMIQTRGSFKNWKNEDLSKGAKRIFDKGFKTYFLKNEVLDEEYCSNISYKFLNEPVTLNGLQNYNLKDIKDLQKKENGEFTDPFTRENCKISDYVPAHHKIINMSAVKIYALWKEVQLEKVDWTVQWQLTEYLYKESKFLEKFVQDLSDKVDKVFKKLGKESQKKIKTIEYKQGKKIVDIKKLETEQIQLNKEMSLLAESVLNSVGDSENFKSKLNEIRQIVKIISQMRLDMDILETHKSDRKMEEKRWKDRKVLFYKNMKNVRNATQAVKNQFLKLRNPNISSDQIPTIHAGFKKPIGDLIKATHKNAIYWIPREIYTYKN